MAKRWMGALAAVVTIGLLTGCTSVVARVNGKDITRKQFIEEMERSQGAAVLHQAIVNRLLLDKAEAEGVTPTAEQIQQEFEKFRQERFGGDETKFRQWLKAQGLDDVVLYDQIKIQLAMQGLQTKGLNPTDEQLKVFFDEHKQQFFDKPERVTFRQIVVDNAAAAHKLIEQLNTEGVIFEQLARQASLDDRSRENGGLYEDFPLKIIREQAAPVAKALEALEPNQHTQQPVASNNGFFVLKLIERKPAEAAKWDDEATRTLAREQYLRVNAKPQQEILGSLLQGAEVVVLDERYKQALEPAFASGPATGVENLPPDVQQQLLNPELTEPTEVDEKAMPKPLTGGGN